MSACVIAVVVGCGTAQPVANDSMVPLPVSAPAPTSIGADPETVAMCESFLPDVVGGTVALVDFRFIGEPGGPVKESPFQLNDVEIANIRLSTLKEGVLPGKSQVVTLLGGGVPDQVLGMRRAADGSKTAIGLLIPSQMDHVPEPRLVGVLVGDRFESGDVCADTYTKRLNGAADILGVDLADAVEQANAYYNAPSNGQLLNVGWALGAFTGGTPAVMPAESGIDPSPIEMWNDTPVGSRELDWEVMPDEVKDQVDVFGIVVTLPEGFPLSELSFRCELGVGYVTLTNFVGDRPAAATFCLKASTEVDFAGQKFSFPPETWSRELGNRVSLTADEMGNATVTVKELAPGELELITGLTRAQLAQRRDQVKAGEFTSP